ncbi:MAG: porin family protein, partial [Duncaniella sp.]|nr:porin family protein [Duncaniella sp.]
CKTDDIDMDIEGYPMDANARFTMNFIELPVYLSYRLPLNLESSLQVFFGPYFDYGVYGKATADVKFKGEFHGEKVSQSMNLFDDDYDFKRFHVGLGLGAAYTWSRFSVGLSYQWGMTEVVADAESYWNNFNISVGYNF